MHALDSTSAFTPVSAAKRSSRARRVEAASATKTPEIQPLPRWARAQSADPGTAAFSAGAGLALLDQILLAHERRSPCNSDLLAALHRDVLEPISRHVWSIPTRWR